MTLDWLFDEADAARRIEPVLDGSELVAPWLWRLEVVNAVLARERRNLLTAARGDQLLELLEDWGVEMIAEPAARSLRGLAALARSHRLTSYDAIYLEAATSLGLPLFTRDSTLRDAAVRIGVPLVAEAGP